MTYKPSLHIIIFFLLLACISSCDNKPSIPSLAETYNRRDKKPFGAYVVHSGISKLFPENSILYKSEPFEETFRYSTDHNSLYICIAKRLFLNNDDKSALLNYLSEGNDVFISAALIDTLLLNQVGCKLSMPGYFSKYYYDTEVSDDMDDTHIDGLLPKANRYSYYYVSFTNHFYNIKNPYSKVLSKNEYGEPNCVVFFYGKGKLFLHCDPRAFSNYFLLKNDNYKFLEKLMSYTKSDPDKLYWDEYYYKGIRRGEKKSSSALDMLLNNKYLRLAFWLSLILLLLYILFQGKRRQRIIKAIKPNVNTSVAFTETIGRLYLQKKDNHNITQKMITYFNEYIRNRYFLNTSVNNEDFIISLSRKSGVKKEKIESLYLTMQGIQNSEKVSDFELLSLNEKMKYFFVNIK